MFTSSSSSAPYTFITTPREDRNLDSEVLRGILISRIVEQEKANENNKNTSSSAPSPTNRNCAILCHGMLAHKDAFFYPTLGNAILAHCPQITHLYRFDFNGHGSSEGTFQYGGYQKLVNDIHTVERSLTKEGFQVTHLIGHSMGANAVLLYGTQYAHIPHIIALSARFHMMVDHRFSKDDMMVLVRDGVLQWRVHKNLTIPITLATYQERLRTDMTSVSKITQHANFRPIHTLIVHGSEDEVIPFKDGVELHRSILAKDGSAIKECSFTYTSSNSAANTAGTFSPPLSVFPHTFVALNGSNHNYSNSSSGVSLNHIVTEWINAHDVKQDSQTDVAQQTTATKANL